jgi:hypothetical protein
MIIFETGKTYWTHSVCDHDTVIEVTIAKRTAKTVTDTSGKRFGVRLYDNVERINPWGSYSMAPVVSADRVRAA